MADGNKDRKNKTSAKEVFLPSTLLLELIAGHEVVYLGINVEPGDRIRLFDEKTVGRRPSAVAEVLEVRILDPLNREDIFGLQKYLNSYGEIANRKSFLEVQREMLRRKNSRRGQPYRNLKIRVVTAMSKTANIR